MKTILLILNLLLAAGVIFGGVHLFRNTAKTTTAGFSVKKRKSGKSAAKPTGKIAIQKSEVKKASLDELSKEIVTADIFNQDRCPNIGTFSNARVELTLVGTFKAGKNSGAIILQKTQTRNFPPFGGMPPGMPGGMPGMGGGRRMGIERGGFGQQQDNFANVTRSRQQGSNQRRQIGGARNIRSTRNANGLVIPGTNNSTLSTNTQTSYKQYVRLGETLANGYKLVEVERTRVTLMKGSDKLELELVDASKNAPKAPSRPGKVNQNQVMQQMMNTMQQMQRAQGFQNFQMMRAMQNMNNNQNRSQGTAPRGR